MIPCGTLALQANHAGFPDKKDNPKWRELHASLEDSPQAAASPQCSPDDLYLHLPRERDAWRILSRACGEESLIADLSQTVTRGASRTDHKLPTITPGSVLAMSKACRVLSPYEKILLHGVPLHRLVVPPKISQKQMEEMGGNTMHVHVVGAAMLFALALVDWQKPAANGAKLQCNCKRSKVQGPSWSKVPKRSKKSKPQNCDDQRMMLALRSRWLLPSSHDKKPNSKVIKSKAKPKPLRLTGKFSVLHGTRWG